MLAGGRRPGGGRAASSAQGALRSAAASRWSPRAAFCASPTTTTCTSRTGSPSSRRSPPSEPTRSISSAARGPWSASSASSRSARRRRGAGQHVRVVSLAAHQAEHGDDAGARRQPAARARPARRRPGAHPRDRKPERRRGAALRPARSWCAARGSRRWLRASTGRAAAVGVDPRPLRLRRVLRARTRGRQDGRPWGSRLRYAEHYYPPGAKGHLPARQAAQRALRAREGREAVPQVLRLQLRHARGDPRCWRASAASPSRSTTSRSTRRRPVPTGPASCRPTGRRAARSPREYGVPYLHIERGVELKDADFADLFHLLRPRARQVAAGDGAPARGALQAQASESLADGIASAVPPPRSDERRRAGGAAAGCPPGRRGGRHAAPVPDRRRRRGRGRWPPPAQSGGGPGRSATPGTVLSGAYGEPGTPPPAYPVTYEQGTPAVAVPCRARRVRHRLSARGPVGAACRTRGNAGLHLPARSRPVARGTAARAPAASATTWPTASRARRDALRRRRRAGQRHLLAPRDGGDDAMAMLFEEFIPFVRDELGLGGPLADHGLVHGRVRGVAGGAVAPAAVRCGLRRQRRPVALL